MKGMKLKRCPICNGKAVIMEGHSCDGFGNDVPSYFVRCTKCYLDSYLCLLDSEQAAADMWNDRSKAEAALKRKLKKEFAKEAAKLQVKSDYPLPVGKFEPYKEVTITITAHSGV